MSVDSDLSPVLEPTSLALLAGQSPRGRATAAVMK